MKRLLTLLFIISSFALIAQNRALNFDGGNDYVQTTFQGITGTNPRTVEAWIRTTANALPPPTGTGQKVILNWGNMNTGQRFTLCQLQNNSLRIEVGGSGLVGTTAINDGLWHHIACVYDQSATNDFTLYIDGVLEIAGNLPTAVNTASGPLEIGRRIDGINLFDGDIDEVRIWDVALTSTQINANKNNEFCAAQPNLLAYYKFNHGVPGATNSGVSTLVDYSGNNYDGTLNSFALGGNSSNWIAGNTTLTSSLIIGTNDTISGCLPYQLPSGATINSSGIFYDTALSVFGCDSAFAINFTALPNSTDSISVTNCDGYFAPSGAFFNQSGKYIDVLTNSIGCDSLITIDLTINSSKTNFQTLSACKSFMSPVGNTYTTSGTYFDTLSTLTGCDSVIVSNLTITSDIISNFATHACDTFITNKGAVVTTSSIFSDTVVTGTGCDSIFNYNIQVGYTNGSNASGIECLGSFISDLGNTYTSTGNYTEITTNSQGCDSIINLDVIISSHKSVQLWDTVCRRRVSPSGKYLWDMGGWHPDTLTTVLGCDSNILMFLVVEDIDTTFAFVGGTFRAIETGVNYAWLDCNTGNLIPGETSRTFTPTQDGAYASIVSNGVCTDTSGCKTISLTSVGNTLGKNGSINIFPNPTYNTITISGLEEHSVVKVINLHGQVVFETQLTTPKLEVDLIGLPNGVYQVAIKTDQNMLVEKVIKR